MGCVCTNDTSNEHWSEVLNDIAKDQTEDETDQKPMKVEFLNNSSLISSKKPKRKMILKESNRN